ncbi:MAG: alpha/beta hydrolase [Candidatus Omnitrophota bacterium]|nr:alpha/beta hydrolase [Candidatus Omnitrophota bacterium]
MKLSKVKSVRYCIVFVLCASILAGCSSIPIQTSSSYFKDLYKRIQYTMDGRYRVVDIFYATTRKLNENKTSSIYFTNKISDSLATGELNIKIDPGLRIEKMLPKRLKREGIIGIQDITKSDEDAFIKKLSDTVKSSPHKSLLVVVFGYKDDFEATAIKAAYFAYLLDINTPVLLFDWPGDQPVDIGGYKNAQGFATESGHRLGELLIKINREVKPEKLWVKASSLGCQVVCDAFDQMYKCSDCSDADTEIDHVILAAPDVSQDEFDNKFKEQLMALSNRLTAYVSSDDEALLVSGLINDDRRLGRQKPRIKDPAQLEEAKNLLYLKSQNPDRVTVIDVTPINYASYKHGYYLESPEFFDDFYMRIFGTNPSLNRRLYLLKFKDKTDYWVLQGNR